MLKAIETIYNGYRFRSRLEARWAVFFDTLGVKYEYEKEGFDLGDDIRYLPDFWLSEQKCWVEVKGQELTKEERIKGQWSFTPKDRHARLTEEMIKANRLAQGGYTVYVCYGPISEHPHILMFTGLKWDQCQLASWYQCRYCKKFVIWPSCIRCCYDPYAEMRDMVFPFEHNAPRILAAYTAARQARFEFGETPQPPKRTSTNGTEQRREAIAFARDIRHLDSWVTP